MHIQRINPGHPQLKQINTAAHIIKDGGIVIFPTRCLYGLGADAFNADAVARLFTIKRRPENNPLLVLIPNQEALDGLVQSVSSSAQHLLRKLWPGKITIIMKAKAGLPQGLTAGTNKIGVRLPGHPVAAALVKAAGRPITGTSANISGQPGCSQISEMPESLLTSVNTTLDAGPLQGGTGSTVIDATGKDIQIIREGVVSRNKIEKLLSTRP